MGGSDFAAARARILELYAAGAYEEALTLTRTAAREFRDEDARTTYWSACLLARLRRNDLALQALEAGVRRGLWWAPQNLAADPDLEPLRGSDRFRTVIDVSHRAQQKAAARPPREPIMRPPAEGQPRAVLVILHGRGQSAEDVVGPWSAADLLLVAPHSTQPFGPRTGCWDDPGRAEADVRRALQSGGTGSTAGDLPLVLAGFSQGAGLAVFLAARQRLPRVTGCLAVAPLAAWAQELMGGDTLTAHGLRFALVAGSRDPRVDECRNLTDLLANASAGTRLDIVKGLGRDYPAQFGSWLRNSVDWVLGG